jgi:hypothetical protein
MHPLAHHHIAQQTAEAAPHNDLNTLASFVEASTCTFYALFSRAKNQEEISMHFPGDETHITLSILEDRRISVNAYMPVGSTGRLARVTDFERGLYIDLDGKLEVDNFGLFHAQCKESGGTKDYFWGISLPLSPVLVPLVNYCIYVAREISKGASINDFPRLEDNSTCAIVNFTGQEEFAFKRKPYGLAVMSSRESALGFRSDGGNCEDACCGRWIAEIMDHFGHHLLPVLPFVLMIIRRQLPDGEQA